MSQTSRMHQQGAPPPGAVRVTIPVPSDQAKAEEAPPGVYGPPQPGGAPPAGANPWPPGGPYPAQAYAAGAQPYPPGTQPYYSQYPPVAQPYPGQPMVQMMPGQPQLYPVYIDPVAAQDAERDSQAYMVGIILLICGILVPVCWLVGAFVPLCMYSKGRKARMVSIINGCVFLVFLAVIITVIAVASSM